MNALEDSQRIEAFDGLRGIAVLAVFLEHFVLKDMLLGSLGVVLFFALSGYLIIGILHVQRVRIERKDTTIKKEFLRFWFRRILRIFPLYYAVLTLLALSILFSSTSFKDSGLLWYATYTSNFYIAFISKSWSDYSHLWSLAIEQQFYVFAAPLFLMLPASTHIKILIATVLAGVISLALFMGFRLGTFAVGLFPLQHFAFMAIGGLVAVAGPRLHLSERQMNLTIAVGGLCAIFCIILTAVSSHKGQYFTGLMFLPEYLFTFIVIFYISFSKENWIIGLLTKKWLVYFGTISYGFYIFHHFAPSYGAALRFFGLTSSWWVGEKYWFLAQFAFSFIAASFSWHFLEKPILKLKDFYAKKDHKNEFFRESKTVPVLREI